VAHDLRGQAASAPTGINNEVIYRKKCKNKFVQTKIISIIYKTIF
jgi:hypothetical protein